MEALSLILGHLTGPQIPHPPWRHCRVLVEVGQALLERVPHLPFPTLEQQRAGATCGSLGAREQSSRLTACSCLPRAPWLSGCPQKPADSHHVPLLLSTDTLPVSTARVR